MKAIERNLYQHENGTYYALWTVPKALQPGLKGKNSPKKKSLETKNLNKARSKLRKLLQPGQAINPPLPSVASLCVPTATVPSMSWLSTSVLMPQVNMVYSMATPSVLPVSVQTPATQMVAPTVVPTIDSSSTLLIEHTPCQAPAQARPPFLEAVQNHQDNTAFGSDDTGRNFQLRQRTMLEYCKDWDDFQPVAIWKKFNALGHVSAPNQLRWYLRSFVEYCCTKEWLDKSYLKAVKSIPLKKVPPRRVKIPPIETTSELLAMCEAEHQECGAFLRFLAVTGQRKTAGNGLRWEEVDFDAKQFWRLVKGGETEYFPMLPEAIDLLKKRHENAGCPRSGLVWGFTDRKLKKATRILKKYAKGLELELDHFHALRHHFASVALDSGMSPADVAKLLGHKDGGVLVLKTYGHIIEKRMAEKVAKLKIAR